LLTVMNPTGNAPPIELKAMAPRPQSLDGKTVYLVDVTFNGGDLLLQQMQRDHSQSSLLARSRGH
jgi:hypothetical protein